MKKKILALLLAAAATVSLLSGCGADSGVMDTANANAVAGGNSDLPVITWKMGSTWGAGNVHFTVDQRFSEILSQLTGGRYEGVVLDRQFRLSAEPAGDGVYRDAQLLSAGALDQLYLAVRLAICQLVLPQEREVPMVLDDALANFDDARCAAALDYLTREAQNRQILLFTCHSREADFLENRPEVAVWRLTEAL